MPDLETTTISATLNACLKKAGSDGALLTPDQRRSFVSAIDTTVRNISQLSRRACFSYLLRNQRVLADEDHEHVLLAREAARVHIDWIRTCAGPHDQRTAVHTWATAQHHKAALEQLRADFDVYRHPQQQDRSTYADCIPAWFLEATDLEAGAYVDELWP